MVYGDVGSFDTRFERLTDHYRDAIARGELKPGDRFPSARELSEMHKVGRTTAGRVHGTLISLGLIEHRAGIGTFVLGPPPPPRTRPRSETPPGRPSRRSTTGPRAASRRPWPTRSANSATRSASHSPGRLHGSSAR